MSQNNIAPTFEVLHMEPQNTNSVLVVVGNDAVIFDAWGLASDWEKLLTSRGLRLRAVYTTHGHADHILGMDDLRRFCDIIPGNKLDVISSREGMERISQIFPYALHDIPDKPGYPCFSLSEAKPEQELFGGKVLLKTELLPHGPIETLGLVFEAEGKKLAYFSDCKTLTPRAMDMAAKADLLAIDGLRLRDHPSHMSLFTAMGFAKQLEAKQTYIIHTTSEIDYSIWEPKMPENCHLAYDGLSVQI